MAKRQSKPKVKHQDLRSIFTKDTRSVTEVILIDDADDAPCFSKSTIELTSRNGGKVSSNGGAPAPEVVESVTCSNRGTEATEDDEMRESEPASKRIKTGAAEEATAKKVKIKKTSPKALKCEHCHQLLDNDTITMYSGDDPSAVEEFIALAADCLSLFDGEGDGDEWSERPQHRITNFTVYDEADHLCPFDTGLIEKNVPLYFSGYVKPVYDDTPILEGGVSARRLGPIDAWYIAGFDGGECELIGFTTMYADYLLSHPSDQYLSIFDTLREKTYLSKTIIELLVSQTEELTFEDVINEVQLVVPPDNCPKFTEETLLKHAQFLVEQIESYDRAADEDEGLLITLPAVRGLIKLAGVTLGVQRAQQRRAPKPKGETKTKSTDISHATVVPLVKAVFESIFVDQMQGSDKTTVKRKRCNTCEVCLSPDCGQCSACKDMVKFGGPGKSRQACRNRKCPNMAVQAAEEDEEVEELMKEKLTLGEHPKLCKANDNIDGRFCGAPLFSKGAKTFYRTAEIEDFQIGLGDYVTLCPATPSEPVYVARVISLFNKGNNKNFLHVHWLNRACDTVLGDTHDTYELFLSDTCDNAPLGSVLQKVTVNYTPPTADWAMRGGMEVHERTDEDYYFKFWYDTDKARFEDPLPEYLEWNSEDTRCCPCCVRRREEERAATPMLDEEMRVLTFQHEEYKAGDYVYLDPDSYPMFTQLNNNSNNTRVRKDKVDEEMFPEYYRKSDYVKGSNELVPPPYRIGRVVKFSKKHITLDNPSIQLTVLKLYRVENTQGGCVASADINLLYYSTDEVTVSAGHIAGKCTVKYVDDIPSLLEYGSQPDCFYFTESYDSKNKVFGEIPAGARAKSVSKGKGKAGSKHAPATPPQFATLRTLDVFSGVGGISAGFHQAGIAESCWAIEFFSAAAQAYKLNNPNTTVFNEDCNEVLRMAMEGVKTNKLGQKIPQKGEVELLCGGPPCQGFSGMNRFNAREYSMFKNSLISSYLSYCEFYRPRYFLLENVRNFVSYKKNMVLKLCLSSLVKMGYQCTFGVLQAGCYGVAQTRRRAFILACAPGEVLPQFPEPRHVFSPKAMQLKVAVDGKHYKSHITRYTSAPYRNITVRDIMSDLPTIRNGASRREIAYDSEPNSWFQRHIRGDTEVLTDHICKEMNPLVATRMRHIPLSPGSDWRDLPNISIQLPDGKRTPVLTYTHEDRKNGRSAQDALRGVCSCAEGRTCDPMDKQVNTLIPWCLPHTGNRHNHWAGLYGRVNWAGFFSTTITNPEPMGKQGRVLHPEQHRLVSVRECARSQGFPDSHKFYGSVLDKHRQVGNAVPPPLAQAIGHEIKKSLITVEKKKCLKI